MNVTAAVPQDLTLYFVWDSESVEQTEDLIMDQIFEAAEGNDESDSNKGKSHKKSKKSKRSSSSSSSSSDSSDDDQSQEKKDRPPRLCHQVAPQKVLE